MLHSLEQTPGSGVKTTCLNLFGITQMELPLQGLPFPSTLPMIPGSDFLKRLVRREDLPSAPLPRTAQGLVFAMKKPCESWLLR